jgi:hypothetical protein
VTDSERFYNSILDLLEDPDETLETFRRYEMNMYCTTSGKPIP